MPDLSIARAAVEANVRTQIRALLSTVLLAVTALVGCSRAEDARIEETRAKLVGTWLEEAEPDTTSARRILSLKADGKFTDEVEIPGPDAPSERRLLAGEWSYDGVNLKRRYLQENGRQFSGGRIRYATFPLSAVTQSEFLVDDNIRKRQARYRRVEVRAAR
jgi:hypothetical protein